MTREEFQECFLGNIVFCRCIDCNFSSMVYIENTQGESSNGLGECEILL